MINTNTNNTNNYTKHNTNNNINYVSIDDFTNTTTTFCKWNYFQHFAVRVDCFSCNCLDFSCNLPIGSKIIIKLQLINLWCWFAENLMKCTPCPLSEAPLRPLTLFCRHLAINWETFTKQPNLNLKNLK